MLSPILSRLICRSAPKSTHAYGPQTCELRFRALLGERGDERLELQQFRQQS